MPNPKMPFHQMTEYPRNGLYRKIYVTATRVPKAATATTAGMLLYPTPWK